MRGFHVRLFDAAADARALAATDVRAVSATDARALASADVAADATPLPLDSDVVLAAHTLTKMQYKHDDALSSMHLLAGAAATRKPLPEPGSGQRAALLLFAPYQY